MLAVRGGARQDLRSVATNVLESPNLSVLPKDNKEGKTTKIESVIVSRLFKATVVADEKPCLYVLADILAVFRSSDSLPTHLAEESSLLKLEQILV